MPESVSPGAPLPGKTLRELRARAHSLKPVVWVSGNGATATVLREIDRSLTAHELIKIHAAVDARSERAALMQDICGHLGAHAVHIIGKMLVVFRPAAEEPPPAASRKPAPAARAAKPGSAREPRGAARRARKTPVRGKR
jgi:putative YhbY family RNA-binding protein